MLKVRIDFEIDEVIEDYAVNIHNIEIFKREESIGKRFLFIDKITRAKTFVLCKCAADEKRNYPKLSFFSLPKNAVIIDDDDVKSDKTHNEMMLQIQDLCNMTATELVRKEQTRLKRV